MHIVHVYKDYLPVCGGIENYVRVLAERHVAHGQEVTVLCCAPTGVRSDEVIDGVRVMRLPRLFTFRSMPVSPAMWHAFNKLEDLLPNPVDLIHAHSPFPLGEQAALRCAGRIPIVVTHHSDVVRQKLLMIAYAPLYRRFLRRVDRVIATSPRYLESSRWLRRCRDRSCVIPLGVDIERFTPRTNDTEWPRDHTPTILFVGRLRYYKGLDTLLEAMAGIDNARLRIVGSGPMETELRRRAKTLELSSRVEFAGEISDERLPEVYRSADLFVLPANCRAEAFGTVLLEAMASGLPCISTEVGSGTSWVVQHMKTGLVVPPGQPAAMRDAIDKILEDKELRAFMATAARNRIERHFRLETVCEQVLALYRQVVGKSG